MKDNSNMRSKKISDNRDMGTGFVTIHEQESNVCLFSHGNQMCANSDIAIICGTILA